MKKFIWGFVFIFSVVLYWHWGAGDQLYTAHQVKKEVKNIKAEIAETGSTQILIDKMKAKLDENLTDPQGHFLLAKLYLNDQQVDKAIESFKTANQLKPNSPEIMVKLAETLFFKHNRQLNDEAQKLVDAVIKMDMNNINALNLLGINAYNKNQFKDAIAYWKRVLIQLPLNSDDAKQVEQMIIKASSRDGDQKSKDV